MKKLYFTGTGNCLHVARQIGGELLSIPQLMKKEVIEIEDDAAQQYTVNDACVQCGICTKVCPVGNIRQTEDGHIRFGNYCEVCYACIQNCPQHAIHLPNEQSGVRFRNENVNLQEIIEANCQQ